MPQCSFGSESADQRLWQYPSGGFFLFYFWSLSVLGCSTVISHFHPRLIDVLFATGLVLLVSYRALRIKPQAIVVVFIILIFFLAQILLDLAPYNSYLSLFFRLIGCSLVVSSVPGVLESSQFIIARILKYVIVYLGLLNLVVINFFPYLLDTCIDQRSGYSIDSFLFLFNRLPYSLVDLGGISIYRNQAIFSEPGMFACLILIYLYVILVAGNERNLFKVAIPVFILLTTFSTTGFIGLTLIFLYWLLKGFQSLSGSSKLLQILFSVAFSLPIAALLVYSYNYKVTGDGIHSFQYRMYDLLSGYNTATQNPILGTGYDPLSINKISSLQTANLVSDLALVTDFDRGGSNGLANFARYFGLLAFFFYLCLIYHQKIFSIRPTFFMLYLVILSSQPIFALYFNIFVLSSSSIFIGRRLPLWR